ncbi:MAG: flagellar hook-basal body protein [Lachnospiraceae bacterium]|nr:flagellar hook-basal body protein [Lachnospiraceae bacterium]
MLKGLYTAYTGMINEQHRMDVLTNNLANSTTIGYKKEGTTSQAFDDVLAYKVKDVSEAVNIPRRMGVNTPGVKIGENYTDYSQGSFKITDNTYDLALGGEGFFTIEFTPKGSKNNESRTMYTRDGQFSLTKEGYLVTKDGDFVVGSRGRIKIDPTKESTIDSQGNIYQDGARVDSIKITDFKDYNYLKKYGENLLEPVEGATITNAAAKVYSGYLEASNVQIVSEMVDMITVTRQYEANEKVIKAYDNSLEIAATQLGRI